MTPSLLNLILWAPFLLVLLISGLIFCISGYKKGLWRSLISLGVTIVSAAISMLLANVLAKVIAPSVVALVPMEDVVKDIPISPDTVAQIVGGLIGSVISLVLFVILMFVLTLILKLVSNAIKRRALITTQKGYKLGGLGVRFVDAVLYTVLLLLPIYGSIQAYAPTVQSLLSFVQTEDNEEMADIKEYVEVLASHPVVMMTKPSPIAAVYKGLQSFEVGDAVVNIPEIVETAKTTVSMLEDLSKKDITELGKEDLEIIDHLRDNVVDQDWFYAVADEGIKALKEQIPADSDDEYMQMLLPLLDMDKDSFKENCTALLDIAELLIKHDIINMMQKDEIDVVKLYESGCISEALRIVNGSNQLLAIKSMVIEKVVTELFGEDKAKADEFLKTLKLEKLETEEQLKKEAEAIGVLVMNQSSATILELIARHPMFTDRSLDMILDNFPMSEMLGFSGVLGEFVDTAEMTATLKSKLEECSKSSFGGLHFADYTNAIFAVNAVYSDYTFMVEDDTLSKGGEAIEFALSNMGSFIKTNYPNASANVEKLLKLAAKNAPFTKGECYVGVINSLDKLITAIKTGSEPATLEQLTVLDSILASDNGCAMIKALCKNGSDPLSLSLDANEKKWFDDAITALKAKYDEAAKKAEERKALDEAIRRGEEIRSEFSDGKVRYYDSKGNLLYEEEMDISIGGGSFEYGEYEGDMNGDLDIKYEYGDLGDGFDVGSVNGDSAFSGSFGGSFIISGINSFEKPQNLDANLQSLLKFLGV